MTARASCLKYDCWSFSVILSRVLLILNWVLSYLPPQVIVWNNMSVMTLCDRKYKRIGCQTEIFFTKSLVQLVKGSKTLFGVWKDVVSQDASMTVISKPRIDHIDYFSFVLGTVGVWLVEESRGFSVLSLNPVTLFLSPIDTDAQKSKSSTHLTQTSKYSIEISNMKARMRLMEIILAKSQNKRTRSGWWRNKNVLQWSLQI